MTTKYVLLEPIVCKLGYFDMKRLLGFYARFSSPQYRLSLSPAYAKPDSATIRIFGNPTA